MSPPCALKGHCASCQKSTETKKTPQRLSKVFEPLRAFLYRYYRTRVWIRSCYLFDPIAQSRSDKRPGGIVSVTLVTEAQMRLGWILALLAIGKVALTGFFFLGWLIR